MSFDPTDVSTSTGAVAAGEGVRSHQSPAEDPAVDRSGRRRRSVAAAGAALAAVGGLSWALAIAYDLPRVFREALTVSGASAEVARVTVSAQLRRAGEGAATAAALLLRARGARRRRALHLHAQRLRIAAAEEDAAGVLNEAAAMEWTLDRIPITPADRQAADTGVGTMRIAADGAHLASAADHAARIAARLRAQS